MKKTFIQILVLTLMLFSLPLIGIGLSQKRPIMAYLEFPPRALYVQHAPFSWVWFVGYGLFILTMIMPFLIQGARHTEVKKDKHGKGPVHFSFPWWGAIGILWGIGAWIMAWSRFPWFSRFQAHTFTSLWIGYILAMNAFTYTRTGHCLLLNHTRFYAVLFPVSAAFWWFFEYLNRFVQNWVYVGDELGPLEYFLYATLPFSTVLPAIMATQEWILSFTWPERRFAEFIPINPSSPKTIAWILWLFSAGGLAVIGVYPNVLFPLLWISPLLILVSLQAILNEPHIFASITRGDWRGVVSSALAGLFCGLFWEMWNYLSLAQWKYHIPFVHGFQVFEMPVLGYAGYLPFGLECVAIACLTGGKREKGVICYGTEA